MRKSFYLWSMTVATLLMASCSNEDVPNNGNDVNQESAVSYLSVKLMSSDASSRADIPFEYGTAAENKVNKVRFYFFTASGAAANVKLQGSEYVNYYDWTPETGDQTSNDDGNNVGSKLNATLVIQTPNGDKLPQQIAAVINPVETAQSRSLQDLQKLQKDYASSTYVGEGKFVMFNSSYGAADGSAKICAVSITSGENGNLAKTPAKAKANPVIMHVERCVAKVTVTMADGLFDANNMLALKNKEKDEEGNDVALTVGGEQVYLKINGWKVTAETTNSNLVKNINLDWNNSSYKDWWNNPTYRRSCWAINSSTAENRYFSYDQINTPIANTLYTNENAEKYDDIDLNNTKVILKGTLCHADGTPFTIVRHLGAYFADNPANLTSLKNSILTQLKTQNTFYWKDGNTFKSIAAEDLQILAVDQDGKESSPKANDCYVYAQLTDAAKAKNWYLSNSNEAPTTTADEINSTLKNKDKVDQALVWNSGMTYYFYEIIHNIDDNDVKTIGVVRNHVYKTRVTKIAGLGTPVYDPELKIYPEVPDPNDHYIAAQINILAWHVVNNDYELEW